MIKQGTISFFSVRFLLGMLLWLASSSVWGQTYPYGNEWIDYGKTYYKFKVFPNNGSTISQNNNNENKGNFRVVHRITKGTLNAYGLGNTQAQDFQLWRNGEQVPLYTSVSTGILDSTDFIEFWGEINDGKPDLPMYRSATDQYNGRWSLFTDTACYYLTINPGGSNTRIKLIPNTASSTSLPVEQYFMHTIKIGYRENRFGGFGVDMGGQDKIVRSSTFDAGEGWADRFFGVQTRATELSGLMIFRNGPPITFKYSACGGRGFRRNISVSFRQRESPILDTVINTMRLSRLTPASSPVIEIPSSVVPPSNNLLIIYSSPNNPAPQDDILNVLEAELTYPRRFEFNTSGGFEFAMPATTTGQFIKITGFFNPTVLNAVLYDLTNLERIETVRQNNEFWFVLPPSVTARRVVFSPVYSTPNIIPRLVQGLEPKTFTNYAQSPANYLIISNSRLFRDDVGTNHVQQYANYRSSAAGGAYTAKVYDVEDLYDQFSFGIRKHPLAVRNFIRFANDSFTNKPRQVFIVGRGVTYNNYAMDHNNQNSSNVQNLVPTWGWPASDNMLAAHPNNLNTTPLVPIGRLAAVLPTEVRDYLEKVKEFEALENQPLGKPWQKEVLHLVGGNDNSIVSAMTQYMDSYKKTIADSFVAANVETFVRLNNPNTSTNNSKIQQRVTNGAGLVSYFGHSSSTSLDFNLNNPFELQNNNGKYPFYLLNGCNASEFFVVNESRTSGGNLTLSERFVLAKQRGAIGFASSSHFGVMQYLDLFSRYWYKSAAQRRYGQGIGSIMQDAVAQNMDEVGLGEFYGRLTAEQYILHGDPAIRIFAEAKPDFVLDSNSIQFTPATATISTDSIAILVRITNKAKSTATPVQLTLTRKVENKVAVTILQRQMVLPNNQTEITVKVPILGNAHRGWNYFTATIDALNQVDEYQEDNNTITDSILISNTEIKPVLPHAYAIVNAAPIKFVGNVANPFAQHVTYRFQLDTTTLFSSSSLVQQDVIVSGATVELLPSLSLLDSTVYYWRMAALTNGLPGTWHQSSFIYLPTSSAGFNQSHFYQHQQSEFSNLKLNNTKRNFDFDSTKNNLYITQSIFPTSGTEDGHFSLAQNGDLKMRSACIGQSIVFNVFDGLNFRPWTNKEGNRFGSAPYCSPGREYNFEFKYFPASQRRKIMDFIDSIPKGMIVAARLVLDPDPGQSSFTSNPPGKADSANPKFWLRDTLLFGKGNSLYHYLEKQGFTALDTLNSHKTFGFFFKKDDAVSFRPMFRYSRDLSERAILSADFNMIDTGATITSPAFGPASEWKELHWRGRLLTPTGNFSPGDSVSVTLIGIRSNGVEEPLKVFNRHQQDVDISDVDAKIFPNVRLQLTTNSPASGLPYQLDYWRLNFEPIPEGAVAPELYYDFTRDAITNVIKDTLQAFTDSVFFGIAFKNISNKAFADSLVAEIRVHDSLGVLLVRQTQKLKPLQVGDSLQMRVKLPTETLRGENTIRVIFNPNRLQNEQTLENNAVSRQFFISRLPEGRAAPDLYQAFTQPNPARSTPLDTLMGYKNTFQYGIAFKNTGSLPFSKPMTVELSLLNQSGTQETVLQNSILRPLPAFDTLRYNFVGNLDTLSGYYTLRTDFNHNQNEREETLTNNRHTHRFFVDQRAEAATDSIGFFQFTRNPVTGGFADTLLASKDTLLVGIAIKNIGRQNFNANIPVVVQIVSDGGTITDVPISSLKALASGDTAIIYFKQNAPVAMAHGPYTIRVLANPARSVPEQDYSNNSYSRRFFVFNVVLPVGITKFVATARQTAVVLDWESRNESSFDHYEVQHSTKGQQFTTIGKVKAKLGQLVNTYQFVHGQPREGINYYRLKITNTDGSVQYSATRQATFGAAFGVKAQPNPFYNNLGVVITGDRKPVRLSLLNATGQVLLQTTATQNAILNTTHLPAGMYVLLATNSQGQQIHLKVEKQ
ncbi:MAG: T9SS C-terminal target domain-containing protein [Bacteroidetes bacterium]|nr:MAG: T9SS C-terminal target domain-containing protein [Bacteroidota bacterium]